MKRLTALVCHMGAKTICTRKFNPIIFLPFRQAPSSLLRFICCVMMSSKTCGISFEQQSEQQQENIKRLNALTLDRLNLELWFGGTVV